MSYSASKLQRWLPWALLAGNVIALALSVSIGSVAIGWSDHFWLLMPGVQSGQSAYADTILTHIRWPRALLGLSVGAVLGITGAALQGLFRNPLAEPSLLGLSAGASLGAGLAIFVASVLAIPFALQVPLQVILAFAFALMTSALIYLVASPSGNAAGRSVTTMLLAGIAITALVGAATSLLKVWVSAELLRQVSLWQMGSLDGGSWLTLSWFVPLVCIGALLLLRQAKALNALMLGEGEAQWLGVPVARVKLLVIALVALLTAAAVAVSGVIGFVGLLAPHAVRLLVGPNHRHVLLNSLLAGALMLQLADIVARQMMAPVVLPVGVITAVVGAPVFLWLLVRDRNHYQWHG